MPCHRTILRLFLNYLTRNGSIMNFHKIFQLKSSRDLSVPDRAPKCPVLSIVLHEIVFRSRACIGWKLVAFTWYMNEQMARSRFTRTVTGFLPNIVLMNDFENRIAPSSIAAIELKRVFINFLRYKNMKNDLFNFHNHTHIDHRDTIYYLTQYNLHFRQQKNREWKLKQNTTWFYVTRTLAQHSIGYDIRWHYLFTTIRYGSDKWKRVKNKGTKRKTRLIDWLVVCMFAWVVCIDDCKRSIIRLNVKAISFLELYGVCMCFCVLDSF